MTIIQDNLYGGELGTVELKNGVWTIVMGMNKELDGFRKFPAERFADEKENGEWLNAQCNSFDILD